MASDVARRWWALIAIAASGPAVVLALVAVTVLMPESRAGQRASLDIVGVLVPSLGLAALTYGFVKAVPLCRGDRTLFRTEAGPSGYRHPGYAIGGALRGGQWLDVGCRPVILVCGTLRS